MRYNVSSMILTGAKIIEEIETGGIIMQPFSKNLVNPNSYNYRLGDYIIKMENDVVDIDSPHAMKTIKIPKEGYVLQPKKLYLGSTYEVIGSDFYVPSLIGRSSLGRLGLFLQITADLGHIGTKHSWTLELTVVQPLIIYARMKIGQVSFWKPDGLKLLKGMKYRHRLDSYSHYSMPHVSMTEKFDI